MAFAGMEWIIVIVVIILLLFGAKKIPELARSLGKARAEISRGQAEVEKEIREAERADREERTRQERDETLKKDDAVEKEGYTELQAAAKSLGIDPKGKTEDELKVLINYKMEQG